MKLQYLCGLVVSLSLFVPKIASASTYTNNDRSFSLSLNEIQRTNNSFYYINKGDQEFLGDINIDHISETGDIVTYDGSFKESLLGRNRNKIICSGDINMVRQKNGDRVEMQLNRIFKSGENCLSMGQTFNIKLIESLPIADENGDFTRNNSDTDLSETSGFLTWSKWEIVSSDGDLNCREKPDSDASIKSVFHAGRDRISPLTRGASAIELINGETWMKIGTKMGICYVRANSKYIQPVSIPY